MSILYYESSLAHHGVKGQKWGVRRTPEQLGHKRPLKDLTNKAYHHDVEWAKKALDGVEDATLPAGIKTFRITNSSEETPGRKYVAFTPSDIGMYSGDYEHFEGRYQKEYTLTKDIKIAGGLTAFDTVLETNDKLANTKIKDLIDSKSPFHSYGYMDFENDPKFRDATVEEAFKSLNKDRKTVSKFLLEYGSDFSNTYDLINDKDFDNKYTSALKAKGYDAVIDLVDSYSAYDAEYPLILINDKCYKNTGTLDKESSSDYDKIYGTRKANEMNRKRQKE